MGQSHIERERERAMTRGRTDYTLLLLLSVTTSSGSILRDRHYLAELNPEAGSNWGDWGRHEFCPEGSWASGFQLKVEKDCGAMCDDTALNGVRLFCTGVDGSDRGGVSSLVTGPTGECGPHTVCVPHTAPSVVCGQRWRQTRSE